MSVVVELRPDADAIKTVIEYLEDLLAEAKAGKITEFVMLYRLDGEYQHCWTGCENLYTLIGQLESLSHLQKLRLHSEI